MSHLLEKKVQDVAINEFLALTAGDILFIDSSQVAKTGSDVMYLFLEMLPLLRPGVLVHIHDVFLPSDYAKEWVLNRNRSWNEEYLLHALLIHPARYRVLFGSANAAQCHGEKVVKAPARADDHGMSGGGFWIEVVAKLPEIKF
ncbi:MAG TPA: hypothetical protein PK586_15505 [Casimicrobium sp.]|nr:hypothetical protein [Casimicrobium sp.]